MNETAKKESEKMFNLQSVFFLLLSDWASFEIIEESFVCVRQTDR